MSSKFYTGDSLEVLRTLPDNHVQCVVTSPPYWGLRDYGVAGQLGLEPTPDEYIAKMTEVFREVRRVLRDDGTCWVNMGDKYNSANIHSGEVDKVDLTVRLGQPKGITTSLKSKDLIGMPWRLAFALQADDWYLRSDIIWHKPSPMPESVRDRPTKSHEYVFLLTKKSRYFWDGEACREKAMYGRRDWCSQQFKGGDSSKHHGGGPRTYGNYRNSSPSDGRNIRSIWTIPSKPFKESHFATFPPALVERCVKAGTSERGCCPICGKAWERIVEMTSEYAALLQSNKALKDNSGKPDSFVNCQPSNHMSQVPTKNITIGFQPACACRVTEPVSCTVLDPFSGAGTVALVCERLGRDSIGIELNPKYVAIAERRLERNRRRKVNGHGKEVQDLPGQAQFAWASDAK